MPSRESLSSVLYFLLSWFNCQIGPITSFLWWNSIGWNPADRSNVVVRGNFCSFDQCYPRSLRHPMPVNVRLFVLTEHYITMMFLTISACVFNDWYVTNPLRTTFLAGGRGVDGKLIILDKYTCAAMPVDLWVYMNTTCIVHICYKIHKFGHCYWMLFMNWKQCCWD